ncbi:flagellar motor protein MotD [Kaarinaea lacus]
MLKARRKRWEEEDEKHDRWLVSYADFVTLLFAFFVVMYSISFINEGKYRVLSDSISLAFDPRKENLDIRIERPVQPAEQVPLAISRLRPELRKVDQIREEDSLELKSIASRVKQDLTDLIDKDLVSIKEKDLWLEVEIKSSILFPSGSASPSGLADPVLNKIAAILENYDNQVQVEGFTDNVPITNEIYPSNWELSAARAASVVHLFTKAGVDPIRLSAVGYGEYRPIASNDTEQGRGKNRRVNIIILSDSIARRTESDKSADNEKTSS